jgi:hypothetical protein
MTDEVVFRLMDLEISITSLKLVDCYLLTPIAISCLMRNCNLKRIVMTRLSAESTATCLKLLPMLNAETVIVDSLFPTAMKVTSSAKNISLSKTKSTDLEADDLQLDIANMASLKLVNINFDLGRNWPASTTLRSLELENMEITDEFLEVVCNSARLVKLHLTNSLVGLKGFPT